MHKCVVSFCKGNYEICPKVATFGYLNYEEFKKKTAILRKECVSREQSQRSNFYCRFLSYWIKS